MGPGSGLSRRRFLAASGGVALAGGIVGGRLGGLAGRADASGRTQALTAGSIPVPDGTWELAPPGTAGLMAEAVYQSRVDEYLALATASGRPTNPTGIAAHLIRAHRDPAFTWAVDSVTVDLLADVWAKIDDWEDTRDFDLMYLLWLHRLGQGDTPMTRLSPDVIAAIHQRFVDNRYRYDDPLPDGRVDNLWFWSENHRIIGLTLEFLGGQRFSRNRFTVTGLSGTDHAARARPDILEWIHERAELGFFEWHSNVYMLKNITPLLMLSEMADDPEVANGAALALDLCLVDLAAHTHAGCYTAPRGRTYKKDKMSSLDEATFGTAKFVFDDTDAAYPSLTDNGVTYFCAATRYRPPQATVDIATDPRTSVVRERHGVYFDGRSPLEDHPAAPYGKDFEDLANIPFWWSLGAIGMWPMARASVEAANANNLWDTELFEQLDLLASINGYDPERIRVWEQERAAVINFGFLSEANTYAYREDEVSMATVIDHRPGEMRDQAHAWQAAIDENAMVFTNHPVTDVGQSLDWREDGRPGYWTGEASMPRSAQHGRTGVHLYLPAWDEATDTAVWSVFGYRPYTHAYVPQDHFDRVVQTGHWTVVERSGAYIGLWSWREPTWRVYDPTKVATRGMVKPFDLVAEGGPDNVWLVELGTASADGSLDSFAASLTASDPQVGRSADGFTVGWASPSSGSIGFSSTGDFTVEGVAQPLGDFPRHESPWGNIAHGDRSYQLTTPSSRWSADFASLTRKVR